MAATSRILLLSLVALLLAVAAPARAEDHLSGTVFYYADSDHVSVLSPALAGSKDIGPWTATARASVDVVTAASVDLVSAASPRGFSEQRVQVDLGASYDFGRGRRVDALFAVSHEPDFLNVTGGAGLSWDVANRNATLGLRYAFSGARIGRTDDSAFQAGRDQHQIELSFSPLLGRTAVADVAYSFSVLNGYLANPYRFVRLYSPGETGFSTAVTERDPDLRVRHALVLRLRKRLTRVLFAMGEYDAYADTWGVVAHSALLRGLVEIGPLMVYADARAYHQTGATFYRRQYDTFPSVPRYRTADKELGPSWTALGGLHADWQLRLSKGMKLRIGGGGDVLYMRYLDSALLSSRLAGMASFDVTLEL